MLAFLCEPQCDLHLDLKMFKIIIMKVYDTIAFIPFFFFKV